VSHLAIQSIRAAIERYGTAEVSGDRLAAMAGAAKLDPTGWAEIERFLSDHDLIVIKRPAECHDGSAAACIMAR
jgi:hypothetical protein